METEDNEDEGCNREAARGEKTVREIDVRRLEKGSAEEGDERPRSRVSSFSFTVIALLRRHLLLLV